MYKNIIYAFTLVCLLSTSLSLFAQQDVQRTNHQSDRIFHIEAYLNGGIPVGNYGKYSDLYHSILMPRGTPDPETVTDGNCAFNFGLGVRFCFDLPIERLQAYMNVDALIGSLNSKFEKDLRDALTAVAPNNKIDKLPIHINVPFTWGLHYDWQLGEYFGFFGELGVGFNIAMLTEMRFEYEYLDPTTITNETAVLRATYQSKICPTFNVGLGANIGHHLRIGAYYYFMGAHNIEMASFVNNELISRFNHETGFPRLTNQAIMLRLGFIF